VVDKQIANKTNKHLEKKKIQVQEQFDFSLHSCGVTAPASSPGVGI
jgi:hypothetical protein